jgi:hypothetical protein
MSSNSKQQGQSGSAYASQAYWNKRSSMRYYRYINLVVRALGRQARSMVDVGTGNCPYLEWFDWIPERLSVDIRTPYTSPAVKGIQGDIFKLNFDHKFELCTCLQVMEHVPDAGAFGKRLMELSDLLIVSLPYKWPVWPQKTTGHIHDPVDEAKLAGWMGRKPNYHHIIKEPFSGSKGERLVAIYHRDPDRDFSKQLDAAKRLD